jgi:ankyrin repeat protein
MQLSFDKKTYGIITGLALSALLFQGCGSKTETSQSESKSQSNANPDQDEGRAASASFKAAIQKGDLKQIENCIAKGCNPNTPLDQGLGPVQVAALAGQKDALELLLAKGAQLSSDIYKMTVLHYASTPAVAELLLSKGLEIDAKNSYRETPLSKAAERGNADVVEFLISKGADLKVRPKDGDLTILNFAGNRAVAEVLASSGADINGTPSDYGRNTPPIISAVWNNHPDVVTFLIEKGANPNAKNYASQTALRLAVEGGHDEIVRILLDQGATIAQDSNDNLMTLSIQYGHPGPVSILLEKGADVNSGQVLPLTAAAAIGSKELVDLLLNHGANVNGKNSLGFTAVHAAARGKDVSIRALYKNDDKKPHEDEFLGCVKSLLDHGAEIQPVTTQGLTPLHLAASGNMKKITELLVERGADVNSKDRFDATPLHWAVINDATDVADFLLQKGAAPNAPLSPEAASITSRAGEMPNPFGGEAVGGKVPLALATSEKMKSLLQKNGATVQAVAIDAPSRVYTPPPPGNASSVTFSPPETKSSSSSSASQVPPSGNSGSVKISAINTWTTPPSAIINGQLIEEGNSFTIQSRGANVECKLKKVDSEQITVEVRGKEQYLPMGDSKL